MATKYSHGIDLELNVVSSLKIQKVKFNKLQLVSLIGSIVMLSELQAHTLVLQAIRHHKYSRTVESIILTTQKL